VVRRAHVQFEERAGQVRGPKGAKTAQVESVVAATDGTFTVADLERICPGVRREMTRRVLRWLQQSGAVECLGRGPGALWRRKGNTLKRG
jgi:hypothetical protein